MFKRTGTLAGRFVASHGARHSDRSLQRLGERRRRWSLVDYDGQGKQVAIAFRPASIVSLAEQKAGVSVSSVSVIGNALRLRRANV